MSKSIANSVLEDLGIEVGGELSQYGVLGMKWGVQRPRGANGRVKRTVSEDHVNSRQLKRKKRSEMSNTELKKLNERLQLERQNNELQSRSALQKIKNGTTAAATILAVGTTITTAYNFSQSPAGKAIADRIRKAYSSR